MLQEDWETTKLNVPGRQKVGGHSWKYLEHVQLYSDLLQALKRVSLIALDSLHRRTLISASAVPRCGAMECKTEGCPTQYICVIRLGFIIQCAVFECAAIRRPTFTQNLHKTQQDGTKQYKTRQHNLYMCAVDPHQFITANTVCSSAAFSPAFQEKKLHSGVLNDHTN